MYAVSEFWGNKWNENQYTRAVKKNPTLWSKKNLIFNLLIWNSNLLQSTLLGLAHTSPSVPSFAGRPQWEWSAVGPSSFCIMFYHDTNRVPFSVFFGLGNSQNSQGTIENMEPDEEQKCYVWPWESESDGKNGLLNCRDESVIPLSTDPVVFIVQPSRRSRVTPR